MERPEWETDGRDWPHRERSRFVTAAGIRWHVQLLGEGRGADLLLLHGTGAASHSMAGLAPLLAERFRVIVPDLPGHGFTDPLPAEQTTLPGMAAAIAELLAALGAAPVLVAGHSAGAAILARMALDGHLAARLIVALNGALVPLDGLPGLIFSPMAKFAAASEFVPRLFAWHARIDPSMVAHLLRDTGSRLDSRTIEFYARLARAPGHVAGALAMMAGWDLDGLARDLPRLATPLLLLVGRNDRTVPPAAARRVEALVPTAELLYVPGLGHLAHEEAPETIAAAILERARALGIAGA
ncbi:MAG: alpha/beta fold hydrolase [Geminicoccaceae bacterium]|nr:alpha/beta fold hydrolase [Geminicoccaceae bacterium]